MVRLKEDGGFILLLTALISIPYGSIKRQPQTFRLRRHGLFQFLMVRLKAHRLAVRRGHQQFQFLMVRLKASRLSVADVPSVISIPYGSIKSCPDMVSRG